MPDAIVQMFEHWTEEARKGNVLYAGVAAALTKDQIAIHHEGHRGFETNCQLAVKHLTEELDSIMAPRRLTDRNFSLDSSYVEYPLVSGISWDFLVWLIDAEMRRRRLGGPKPLKVAFTMPDQIDPNRVDFFNNVCRPLLPLIGAVEHVNASGGRYNPFFTAVGIVAAARSGEEVPKLSAWEEAKHTMSAWLHGIEPIVITLREVGYFAHRNSNIDAWLKFATDLQQAGEDVVFVRDTAKARDGIPGFSTCPPASVDVQYRMALYERAKANFCVANGPGGLLFFSDLPYGYFVNLKSDDTTDLRSWRVNQGLDVDEQWPWATDVQKLVWQTDDYENISATWEQLKSQLKPRIMANE